MNKQQIFELKQDEGLKLLAYDDATERVIKPGSFVSGHPTIGFGRALDVHGITPEEAEYLLNNDIGTVETALNGLAWFRCLDPIRQGVLTNMAFNMGVEGMLSFHNMVARICAGDYLGAASEMMASQWWKQIQQSRRTRLQNQMRSGAL